MTQLTREEDRRPRRGRHHPGRARPQLRDRPGLWSPGRSMTPRARSARSGCCPRRGRRAMPALLATSGASSARRRPTQAPTGAGACAPPGGVVAGRYLVIDWGVATGCTCSVRCWRAAGAVRPRRPRRARADHDAMFAECFAVLGGVPKASSPTGWPARGRGRRRRGDPNADYVRFATHPTASHRTSATR